MDDSAANEVSLLRAEAARLRAALQNINTTLESASDDSLRAAVRMVKGMAVTALAVPPPPRPISSPAATAPPRHRPVTEPGLPVFNPTPLPERPITGGDQKVLIPPTKEPAKKITEPSVTPFSDSEL